MYSGDEYLLFREVDFAMAMRLKVTLNIALHSYNNLSGLTNGSSCQLNPPILVLLIVKELDMRVTILGLKS